MKVPGDMRTRGGALALSLALAATVFVLSPGDAHAISGGSVAPRVLVRSSQSFSLTYSGKDRGTAELPTPNLIVELCIASDAKPGFNPAIDCSPTSRQNFFDVPSSGTVTYGGDPNNAYAPFIGLDPNNGEWSVCRPSSGVTNYQSGYFRLADFPSDTADDIFIAFVCGPPTLDPDFDGNGGTDISVFRPTTSAWYTGPSSATVFGTSGDIPAPGDYDGDGDTDVAVYRPSGSYWFRPDGPTTRFGTTGDIPVPGDYDGDGDTNVAVFRPAGGYWFTDGIEGGAATQWGAEGDIPVPADYDGDGDTDVAVYRPSSGFWFVEGGATTHFGTEGDIPVPADYDGDGTADIAVFRPMAGVWFVEGGATTQFGTTGDIPVPADYDNDGAAELGVFRPSVGVWFVEDGVTTQFGTTGDVPLPLPDAIRRFFFPAL